MQYSKELLGDIHIRLDREGLDGLDEKEMSVLMSEQLGNSTQQITDRIDFLSKRLDKSKEDICAKIDQSTIQTVTQICVKIDQSTAQICNKIDETVLPIREDISAVHEDISGVREDIHEDISGVREDISAVHEDISTVRESIHEDISSVREDVSPIREELKRFHSWAKVVGIGAWAIAASLIASLIFKACGSG